MTNELLAAGNRTVEIEQNGNDSVKAHFVGISRNRIKWDEAFYAKNKGIIYEIASSSTTLEAEL